MSNANRIAPVLSADICFYGTSRVGFDYLSTTAAGFTADSQPDPTRQRFDSATVALFKAIDGLRAAGLAGNALVAVYAPGGERYAVVRIDSCPAWGSLPWRNVPAVAPFRISPAALEAAAG